MYRKLEIEGQTIPGSDKESSDADKLELDQRDSADQKKAVGMPVVLKDQRSGRMNTRPISVEIRLLIPSAV